MAETNRTLDAQLEDEETHERGPSTGEARAAQTGAGAHDRAPTNLGLFEDPEPTLDEAAQG